MRACSGMTFIITCSFFSAKERIKEKAPELNCSAKVRNSCMLLGLFGLFRPADRATWLLLKLTNSSKQFCIVNFSLAA